MKKGLIFILAFLLSVFLINAAIMLVYHSGTEVSITIDGISNNLNAGTSSLFGTHTFTSSLPINPGHDASQIWVSVKDGEMALLQALQSTNKLCPNPSNPTDYSSSPLDKSKPYHLATEIMISTGSLQSAINAGDFCYVWYTDASSCSVTCGGGTRTTYCSHNGVQVADNYCTGTKPSVSCNIQGCVWVQTGTTCVPADCGLVGGVSYCPTSPAGTACSPINSVKRCGYNSVCRGSQGCTIIFFTCQ